MVSGGWHTSIDFVTSPSLPLLSSGHSSNELPNSCFCTPRLTGTIIFLPPGQIIVERYNARNTFKRFLDALFSLETVHVALT